MIYYLIYFFITKGKSEYCTDLLIQRMKTAKQSKCKQINRLSMCLNKNSKRLSNHVNANGTIIDSTETLEDEIYMNRSHKSSSFRKSNSHYSYGRNSDIDAESKYGRVEHENKRCVQILGEIYVIASVHPQVLETCIGQVMDLFPVPTENIKIMIDRLKELQSTSSLCSSFQYDGSSNPMDCDTNPSRSDVNKKNSFEHSLDSIEINYNKEAVDTPRNNNAQDIDYPLFSNSLHIVECEDNQNSNYIVSSNRPDHDYEVIKKSDDNLLNENDQTLNSEKLEDLSYEITDTTNLLENVSETASKSDTARSNPKQSVISSKTNPIASIFSSDSNQYSLLNTKIAEESEGEEINPEMSVQEKNQFINKFGYLKLDKTENGHSHSNQYKSVSMREASTYDPVASGKIYASTSLSYSSRPTQFYCNKDVVQQFYEKHLDKVKAYIKNISQILPMPVDDIDTSNHLDVQVNTLRNQKFFLKKCKSKKFCFLNFECECKGEFCLYDRNFFETLTFHPTVWVHILFLSIQVRH